MEVWEVNRGLDPVTVQLSVSVTWTPPSCLIKAEPR